MSCAKAGHLRMAISIWRVWGLAACASTPKASQDLVMLVRNGRNCVQLLNANLCLPCACIVEKREATASEFPVREIQIYLSRKHMPW
jgi:hypothetical protein